MYTTIELVTHLNELIKCADGTKRTKLHRLIGSGHWSLPHRKKGMTTHTNRLIQRRRPRRLTMPSAAIQLLPPKKDPCSLRPVRNGRTSQANALNDPV
jgi:hypothetical protein